MGSGKPFEGNGEAALGFLPVIGTAVRNLRPMFGRSHPQKWGGVHGHVDLKGLAEAADTALSCPRPPLESRSPQPNADRDHSPPLDRVRGRSTAVAGLQPHAGPLAA